MAYCCLVASQGVQGDQRIIAGLDWVAAHMGPATTKMTLDLMICEQGRPKTCDNHLIAAISKGKPLNNLRCLTLQLSHSNKGNPSTYVEERVLEHFLWWMLANAPALEALSLRQDEVSCFSFLDVSLDRLKHLELHAIETLQLDGNCQTKTELPVLETLCIDGPNSRYQEVEEIDMARCGCLRQLALKNIRLPRVIRRSSCQPSCHLDILCCNNASTKSMLKSAQQVELCSKNSYSGSAPSLAQGVRGMSASLPCVRVLKVSGEALKDTSLLARCMPVSRLPVQSLRVLVLHADTIKCRIPVGFPNLKELIVKAKHELVLDFEDPGTSFCTLQTFYAFGAPLINKAHALLDALVCPLRERGLCIEAVTAVYLGPNYSFGDLYLRPVNGEMLSIGALYGVASQLAGQCRCGARFTCLRAAGCIE